MSIFYKECPRCAETTSADSIYCRCGYCFEPAKVESADANLEIAAQDEELYEAYLAARVEQAEQSSRLAAERLALDRDNEENAQLMEQALREEQEARTAYIEQKERTAAAQRAAGAVRTRSEEPPGLPLLPALPPPPDETKKPRANGASSPRPAVAKTEEPISVPTPPVQSRKPGPNFKQAQAKRAAHAIQHRRNRPLKAAVKSADTIKAELAAQSARTAEAIRAALAARKQTEARDDAPAEHFVRDHPAAQATKTSPPPAAVRPEKPRKVKDKPAPPPVRAAEPSIPAVTPREQPPPADTPGEQFKTKQVEKAKKIAAVAEKKVCPNCCGSHPADAKQCGCGYVFPKSGAELPSLSLSNADHNALFESLTFGKSE